MLSRARAILTRANIVTCNEALVPLECVTPLGPEHVSCSTCGKKVSGFDPELGLVVRAFVECPECIEQRAETVEGASER